MPNVCVENQKIVSPKKNQEIERKFLVIGNDWRRSAEGVLYRQGYLNSDPRRTVRVRVVGERAFLTVKGPNQGVTRAEFEYEIPVEEAEAMLDTLAEKPIIEKKRYCVKENDFLWEVDEFLGVNENLIVAEIELPSEDTVFSKPAWVGQEVSGDVRYYNSQLIAHPYSTWER